LNTPREIIDLLLWHTADVPDLSRPHPPIVRVALEYGAKPVYSDEEYRRLKDSGRINRDPGKFEVWARTLRRECGQVRDPLGGPQANPWRRCNTEHFWAYWMVLI
jgi:hypothetical protein